MYPIHFSHVKNSWANKTKLFSIQKRKRKKERKEEKRRRKKEIQKKKKKKEEITNFAYTGCPEMDFTFLKFCSFKSKPPIATPKNIIC